MVGAVRADQFSRFAAESHLRDGWCAFHIELTCDHFVFSDQLVMQCAVSGNVLHNVEFGAVRWEDHAAVSPQPVQVPFGELSFRRVTSGELGIRAYQPLIDRISALLNDEQYLNFAFRFILGREPDEDGKNTYLSSIRGIGDRAALLLALLNSEEFAKNRRGQLPSPFDEEFPAVPIFLPTR
jgi:hypothetical protein